MIKEIRTLNPSWLLLSCVILVSSCKKFVEVGVPKTQQVTASVFEEKYTAIAAITGIYGSMSSMANTSIMTGLSSDEFTNYGGDLYSSLYTNALTDKNGYALPWFSSYNFIYQANSAIDGLQQASKLSADIKNQLLGEAKFIRAFWYYYLINLYGDVPLVLTTDYSVIIALPSAPKTDVYNQVINDLKDAKKLLNENYLDSKNDKTQDRVRPTKWVATALLSRVYLQTGRYADAESESTALIQHKEIFQLCPDLNNVFLKNSTEAIWQLMPSENRYFETPDGGYFILTTAPSPGSGVSISPQLLSAFEKDDQRMAKWVDSIAISGKVYYFPFKYKVQVASVERKEYSMVLRLAEQFLIRAEARVQLNNFEGGAADLDSIRVRAGLQITNASTKKDLLNAILHERQVELFSEGSRWIDLKASGKIDEVMSIVTPQKGGGNWRSYQKLYPFAIEDIQSSLQLKQNPGY